MADKICSIDGCEKKVQARGWCTTHYKRWHEHGDPTIVLMEMNPPEICSIDGCQKQHCAKGYCAVHYMRWRNHGNPLAKVFPRGRYDPVCSVEGCDNSHHSKGFCKTHFQRFSKHGDPFYVGSNRKYESLEVIYRLEVDLKSIDAKGCWVSYRKTTKEGYVAVRARGRKTSLHRLSADINFEDFDIDDHSPIHHKCANKACFNPDHLQVVTQAENTAEMFERNFYLKEIERLKTELAQALRTIEELQEASTVRG